LNSDFDNFLKAKTLKAANIIHMREVLGSKGLFRITVRGLENEANSLLSSL
jgi:hypothetical protein